MPPTNKFDRDLESDSFKRCRDVLDVICETPELYAVVHEDIRAVAMRRFPHVIYFRLEIETIVIMAVMHGRRGEAALIRRLT